MRSIPAAMTWELLARGRWSLPAAALGALALPAIVFVALRHEGALEPRDEIMLTLHMVMVQINIALFATALITIGWKVSTLYAMPASAATLAMWRLIPAMALMVVEVVVWTTVLNLAFDLQWPLWGPALLGAAAVAAVQATVWVADRSRWIFCAVAGVAVALGLWMATRYGGLSDDDPAHAWSSVTPADVLTLVAFAALACWAGAWGIARNRRGAPGLSTGLMAWLERQRNSAPAPSLVFRSAERAQFWFAWKEGWVMPTSVAVALAVSVGFWWCFASNPRELVQLVWTFNWFLPVVALIGGVTMGNLGSAENPAMGQFLAARPLTTPAMARITLCAAASSLLVAWALWAAGWLVIVGALVVFRAHAEPLFTPSIDWRTTPASFLGSWIVLGVFTSAMIAGRIGRFLQLVAALSAAYIVLIVIGKFALSPQGRELMTQTVATAAGVLLAVVTGWLFVAGWRRRLVDGRTVAAALALWLAILAVGAALSPTLPDIPRAGVVLLVGVSTLIVAPAAATPLAVAWNRTR